MSATPEPFGNPEPLGYPLTRAPHERHADGVHRTAFEQAARQARERAQAISGLMLAVNYALGDGRPVDARRHLNAAALILEYLQVSYEALDVQLTHLERHTHG